VWRPVIAATPWGRTPRDLVRDRDAVDGRDVVERARGPGVEAVLTPVRARARPRSPNGSSGPRAAGAAARYRRQRSAPALGAARLRGLLQRGPSASHPLTRDTGARRPRPRRPDPLPGGPRRVAPRTHLPQVPAAYHPTTSPNGCSARR